MLDLQYLTKITYALHKNHAKTLTGNTHRLMRDWSKLVAHSCVLKYNAYAFNAYARNDARALVCNLLWKLRAITQRHTRNYVKLLLSLPECLQGSVWERRASLFVLTIVYCAIMLSCLLCYHVSSLSLASWVS